MSTVQVQPGKILTVTAGGAVTSGSVQEVGNDFIGVALAAASGSGVDYPLALEGVFTVGKKTSETWAVGDKVYWDSSNAWASKTYVAAAADAFLGVATAVAGSSVTTGNVKLRGGAEAEVDLDDVLLKSGGQMTGNITMAGSQTVDGRDLSVDGAKLDGIEASADVTDTANVTAAGAVMDTELVSASVSFGGGGVTYSAAFPAGFQNGKPVWATIAASTAGVAIYKASCSAGNLDILFSADPGANTIIKVLQDLR